MITAGKVATIHYILKNEQGEIIDQSESDEPLSYLHGAENIVLGLENALEGKIIGDTIDVIVSPEEGYGEFQADMQIEMPLSQFDAEDPIEVGAQFELEVDDDIQIATIVEIKPDVAVIDLNHPLAGETLYFSVSVVDIRDANEVELDHGHVHEDGEDGDESDD